MFDLFLLYCDGSSECVGRFRREDQAKRYADYVKNKDDYIADYVIIECEE